MVFLARSVADVAFPQKSGAVAILVPVICRGKRVFSL
jgi:hypothetical protein